MEGAKEVSIMERVTGVLVTLVNPRFMYFNRPLCLAITVAVLAFVGFWPLFGYYAWTTTTVMTDNSQTDMTVISGPLMELDTVIMEYSRLPPRCTGSDGHHYFSGIREDVSADGLTQTERTCDYDVCILTTYEFTLQEDWARSGYMPVETESAYLEGSSHRHTYGWNQTTDSAWTDGSYHTHTIYSIPPAYKPSTQMCMIQDEWLQGLVKNANPFLDILNKSGEFFCNMGSNGAWCPFDKELEAYQFVASCCQALKDLGPHQQLAGDCQVLDQVVNNSIGKLMKWSDTYCSPMILHWIDYLEALKNRTSTFYKICPEEAWRYENPAFKGNMPNCAMNGAWSPEPFSFKLLWTRNETVTTRTRRGKDLGVISVCW